MHLSPCQPHWLVPFDLEPATVTFRTSGTLARLVSACIGEVKKHLVLA